MLRRLIVLLFCKPIAFLVFGFSVRHRERLVTNGPAIVVANHNSHLDTFLLFCLFPSRLVPKIRPVAAADYFMTSAVSRWVSTQVIGIIPIARRREDRAGDPLAPCYAALDRGEILVLFPEGTRGEPEQMSELKSGVAHLAARYPDVPVVPVFLRGAGRSLPRGTFLLVPFLCHAIVGERVAWCGNRKRFMTRVAETMRSLEAEAPPLHWE